MARIEPWEQKIRDLMEAFAQQVNNLLDFSLFLQGMEHQANPDQVPLVDPNEDRHWIDKLVTPAKEHITVWGSIVGSIWQAEEGNTEGFLKAVQPVAKFYTGSEVRLEVMQQDGEIRVNREYLGEDARLFTAFVPADQYFEYLTLYKDFVHLGVCRLCQQVYLKPKHGQKMRYCSPAHRQAAYRQRRNEADG